MPTEFDNAILRIADKIKRTLQFIPDNIKKQCEEIRLRQGLPVCLTVGGRVMFVCNNSDVSQFLPQNCIIASEDDMQQTLSLLCNKSIYLHENEIRHGFVSLPYGCRAGVCGAFNADGMLVSITSINIRIARQIIGCADRLLPCAEGGLLIAGPPSCGKTTMLRDLVRQLSNGYNGRYYRVTVIDSRSEISGGANVLDLGVNTDVLFTGDRAKGTDIALRTMFPNFIAFDEIGTRDELDGVSRCFNAGVGILTTAHCNNLADIMRRNVTRDIVKSGAISSVAFLSESVGEQPQILDVKELISDACV